jgi:predicted DNA-binding protein
MERSHEETFPLLLNQQHATLLALFSKVNSQKIRPALEKRMEEMEEAIEKIKDIENKIITKTDERSGDGKANHNG